MTKIAVAVALLTLSPLCLQPAFAAEDEPALAARQRASEAYRRLPLSFTANAGQADGSIAFLAQGSGYSVILSRTKAQMTLSQWTEARHPALDHAAAPTPPRQDVLQLTFDGANAPEAVDGLDQQSSTSNYLIGSDPKQWHTGVPNFARVRYTRIYPGVDLVYYGNQREMEFDLVLKPHADETALRFSIAGTVDGKAVTLALNANGDLVRAGETGNPGEVLLRRPAVYQASASGQRQPIESSFLLAKNNEVRFHLGAYDRSREVVIDPTLAYATYLGSRNTATTIQAVVADALGNAYVGGESTFSSGMSDFPVTPGAYQTATAPPGAAFISKFKADGSGLVYSTYIGGLPTPQSNALSGAFFSSLAVDGYGNVYIAGGTANASFPVTAGAFQTTFFGSQAAYLTKLNAQGSGLVYSTFLNGMAKLAFLTKVVVDPVGAAYVLGETTYHGYPVTPGAFQPNPGPMFPVEDYGQVYDTTLTKVSPDGSSLLYSTYFGGYTATNTVGLGLAIDDNGSAYIGGGLDSPRGFPATAGAFSKVGRGFAVKFNPSGSALMYATLLKGRQYPVAVAVDQAGNLYMTGDAGETDVPVTRGAFNTKCEADPEYSIFDGMHYFCSDAYIQKLNPTGTAQVYTTYLGTGPAGIESQEQPGAVTQATDIKVNTKGEAYVVGITSSKIFPVTSDALHTDPDDPNDPSFNNYRGYLTSFNAAGSGLVYSTYLETAADVAVDTLGHVYVSSTLGLTAPPNAPPPNILDPTPGAFQTTFVSSTTYPPPSEGTLLKLNFGQPFCTFKPTLVLFDQGAAGGFGLTATFVPGSTTPVDPTSTPLTLLVGGYTFTVDPASFHKTPTGYTYQGTLNGVRLNIVLMQVPATSQIHFATPATPQACSATQYDLYATGLGGSFHTAVNPVPVAVSLGDNGLSAAVNARIVH